MSLEPGQIIDGKYKIVRLIGEGGMGSVHEGENVLISRRVAIKVLHAAAAENEQIIKRFEREAQAAGKIGSDHILEVLDLGTLADGDRYMVMEFLQGEELSKRIERLGGIPTEQLARLIRQALVGLKAAHAAGIVHRDLKPDNVFVLEEKAGTRDFVKIIDFGISKFSALSGDMSMTTTGAVMGTPYYMSPEQAKGSSDVDARADLYAVGVIMYEALSGNVPFAGTSFNDLMFKIVLSDAPPLPPHIPADFQAIVQKAMARESKDRYQTAEEFIAALDSWGASNGMDLRQSQHGVSMAMSAELASAMGSPTDTKIGPGSPQTDGNWAATQHGDQPPLTKKSPLVMALAAAAVVAVAGISFALVSSSEETDEGKTDAEQAAQAESDSPVSAEDEAAQDVREPVKEPEPPVVENAGKEAAASKTPEEEKTLEEEKKEPVEKVAPAPAPRPVVRPKPRPAPRPAPTPKPAPKPSFDDFGY